MQTSYLTSAKTWQLGLLSILTFFLSFAANNRAASAQVIQIPTYRTFGIGTSVWVPDRGVVELGRVNRGRMGFTSRGVPGLSQLPGVGPLFTARGVGSSLSTSKASVRASILDLQARDEEVLLEAARIRESKLRLEQARSKQAGLPTLSDEERLKAKFLSRNIGRGSK
jgi:type II secretory pathway component GspD/PulD (secretin)